LRSAPRVADSIAHTPYAIQACLLTGRTAYKYHLFTYPHYSVAVLASKTKLEREVNTMSPSPHRRPNVLETDPENWFGWVQPLFLPSNFRQPSMTFQCLSRLSVFSTADSSQKVHERCHGRLISKYLIAANIRRTCYAATTDTIVLMLQMYR